MFRRSYLYIVIKEEEEKMKRIKKKIQNFRLGLVSKGIYSSVDFSNVVL